MPQPTENAAANAKPASKPRAAKKPPKPKPREVLYPNYEVFMCCPGEGKDGGDGSLTREQVEVMLGLETEEDYAARLKVDRPDLTDEELRFDDKTFQFRDVLGRNCTAWNNVGNRPFNMEDSLRIAQDLLNGKWKFNFMPIVQTTTARVASGQRRLIGYLQACQLWKRDFAHHRTIWPEEPRLATLVCRGCPDDHETVLTIDTGKTNSDTDVLFTGGGFDDLGLPERKECARMMAKAIGLIWKRTWAGGKEGDSRFHKYQSRAETVDFAERHPRLQEAVRLTFKLNKDRSLSELGLSLGYPTGLMYLFAATKTDGGEYRNGDPPREKLSERRWLVDFSGWDKAVQFWTDLAEGDDALLPLKDALDQMNHPEAQGSVRARIATVIQAWNAYAAGEKITAEVVKLEWSTTEAGKSELDSKPIVGGIDFGWPGTEEGESEEEAAAKLEAEKKSIKKEHEKVMRERVAAAKAAKATNGGKPPNGIMDPAKGQPKNGGGAVKPARKPTVQEEQTRRAREADELLARERDATAGSGEEE